MTLLIPFTLNEEESKIIETYLGEDPSRNDIIEFLYDQLTHRLGELSEDIKELD